MKVFGFIFKKDLKPVLWITLVLVIFSVVMQISSYKESIKNEPYYSDAFDSLSEKENFTEAIDAELSVARANSDNVYNEIFAFMYGENYDPYKPPVKLPSELVEKLFVPNNESGIYSPKADTDYSILSQMNSQLYSQTNYPQYVSDRIIGYERNARRGITDEYILAVSDKLTEDYNEVLKTPLEEPVDTRAADALILYLSEDLIPVFGVFIILFSRFSGDIQSRRFMSFSITKYGPERFTLSKIISGYGVFTVFYIIYCAAILITFLIFDKNSGALFAPLQVCTDYELSPEALNVFMYLLVMMVTRFVFCLALGSVVMLASFVCKRTIPAGIAGIAVIAGSLILRQTYDITKVNIAKIYPKIIFSCDMFNMYHDLNYVDVLGTPVKVYVLFFAAFIILTLIVSAVTLLISGKRGVAYV